MVFSSHQKINILSLMTWDFMGFVNNRVDQYMDLEVSESKFLYFDLCIDTIYLPVVTLLLHETKLYYLRFLI